MKTFLKKHESLFLAIAVNLFFLILLSLSVGVAYELSDDWFFAKNIANGNYDYTFCSYFIQILTGVVQKVIYPINAFMLLQIIFGFVSLTAVCYVLLDTFGIKRGFMLAMAVECVFAINAYSAVTFTKTAALLAVAGGLMMLWAYHNKKHIGYSIFGIILILLGSFYRFKIFYSVLAVFACCVLALIISKTRKPFFKSLLEVLKEVLTLKTVSLVAAMLIVVFSCNFISKAVIYSGEGMDYYKTYGPLRSAVVDYSIPLYESAPEKYQEVGMSENDYNMLINWYFDDEGYSDVETLEHVVAMQDEEQKSAGALKLVISNAYYEFMKIFEMAPEGILIIAYLVIAAAILILYKKKSWLFVGIISFAIFALHAYLWLGGRTRYRAVFSIWFAAIICLIYLTRFMEFRQWVENLKERHFRGLRGGLVGFCDAYMITFFVLTVAVALPQLDVDLNVEYPNLEQYIAESEGKTFALSRAAYGWVRDEAVLQKPLNIGDDGMFEKCVYFGSPYYAHPSYDELLASFGIENLYTDIIDNPNLLYIDKLDVRDVDMFVAYLNEQYGENATYGYTLVNTIDGFEIYEIITMKE